MKANPRTSGARQTRHLGTLTFAEEERLHMALIPLLHEWNIPGSILHDYSIWQALEDEVDKARRHWKKWKAQR